MNEKVVPHFEVIIESDTFKCETYSQLETFLESNVDVIDDIKFIGKYSTSSYIEFEGYKMVEWYANAIKHERSQAIFGALLKL